MEAVITTGLQKSAQENLQRLVDQIERLDAERRGIAADISDLFKSAKSQGFDVKILRQILKLRKLSADEREEAESILAVYAAALGMMPTQADIFDAQERELENA